MSIQRIFLSELLMDSESESETDGSEVGEEQDEEVGIVCHGAVRTPRNCIKNYFEEVVSYYTEAEFTMHFRIQKSMFANLVLQFESDDIFKNINENYNKISAAKHIIMFLWFAGHEACSYRDLGDRFDMSLWTVHFIIRRVSMFISNMANNIIVWPNIQEANETANFYYEEKRFPGIIGIIDGTHIRIDPPERNRDEYIDRKGNITIQVQGICNENKKFIDVFIGYPGSVHDSRVLKNSDVQNKMFNTQDKYLLGDSAYPCSKWLMVPFKDNGHLTHPQKHYNTVLSTCRIDIEHTFGILKQRFRQLYYCKIKNFEILCHFIRACCVMHNLADVTDINIFEPLPDATNNEEDIFIGNSEDAEGRNIRNEVCRVLYLNRNA